MPEPFKNLLNQTSVADMATHLRRVWPAFDTKRFRRAAAGLDGLEFKARAHHLCDALARVLPTDFEHAATILESSLAPSPPWGEGGGPVGEFEPHAASPTSGPGLQARTRPAGEGPRTTTTEGLAGWVIWPMTEYIAQHGQTHPERALAALHAMTQRLTAEWALRPFIVNHPALTFATLQRWCDDPSPHVRRLVSEGSRPRLPWGMQLKSLIADPSPTLPLLEALQDDTSDYVRRSVANHLNDIAKDHPEHIVAWLAEHLPDAGENRRARRRHPCPPVIKQGHAGVLAAWGLGSAWRGSATLGVSPKRIRLGEAVTLSVMLNAAGRKAQPLLIDYAVHHVKANGGTAPKVFKGWTLTLAGGESRTLIKRHALREITTRRYHRGTHKIELLINGRAAAEASFELRV